MGAEHCAFITFKTHLQTNILLRGVSLL